MSKLRPVSGIKVVRKLKRAGFLESHSRGSHLYLTSADGARLVTVPLHGSKDIPIGTLYNIVVRQAGMDIEEFNNL